MAAVYLDSYTVEAYVSGAWSNLTSDVIARPISAKWGISGNSAVDLVADSGECEFLLNNQDDLYIPGLVSSLAGWAKNTPVRIMVVYESVSRVRFRGYVDRLDITSEKFSRKSVRVVCVDWMDYAARYPLVGSAIGTSQRADQAITTIVAGMPIAPQATDYGTGIETFLTVFDNVSVSTRGYTEFAKLVNSEWGYLYLTKDGVYGETLVFENNQYRDGKRTLNEIPLSVADSDFLLLETGDVLLLETGDKMVLNEAVAFVIDNLMTSLEIEYGKDVVNHFQATAYPKTVDGSNQILFSIEKPITLTPGVARVFRTNYRDPNGGSAISGTSMVAPVITTDYLMNTKSDGSGSDISASLTIVAAYGTEGVIYTLTNSNADIGYITHLQARGIGVYSYSPIQDIAENAASIKAHGYQTQRIDQRYQQNLLLGSLKADAISYMERSPRVDLSKINLVANRSTNLMYAFLNIDVGDLVHIKEDDAGIDGYYYIQGVSFDMHPGGLITYSWDVRQAFSISKGLTMLALEFDGASLTAGVDGDGINFHYLPHLVNKTQLSYSVWVYKTLTSLSLSRFIAGIWADNSAAAFWVTTDDRIQYDVKYSGAPGRWQTDASTVPNDAWTHIVITQDTSVTPTTDPIIYINGVSVTVNEILTPSGTVIDQTGAALMIGNTKTPALNWSRPFYGRILDVRVYDTILTQANVTTLYNSGTFDNTLLINSNLRFQGTCVKDEDVTTFTDVAFASTDRVIDNIYGFVGTPNNGPTGRTAP